MGRGHQPRSAARQPWAHSAVPGARSWGLAGLIPSAVLSGQAEFGERCLALCFHSTELCRAVVTGVKGAFSWLGAGEGPHVPPVLSTIVQGGWTGVGVDPILRAPMESVLWVSLDPRGHGHPEPVCGEQGLCWPLAWATWGQLMEQLVLGSVCGKVPLNGAFPGRQGCSGVSLAPAPGEAAYSGRSVGPHGQRLLHAQAKTWGCS